MNTVKFKTVTPLNKVMYNRWVMAFSKNGTLWQMGITCLQELSNTLNTVAHEKVQADHLG